jgi:glycosyltransferase involved in cell wall biosynthesis
MNFSIVISAKNDEKAATLMACLQEMKGLPVEIIVVDWGSEVPLELPSYVTPIRVSPELAAKYNKDSQFALNVSSNVGIRRASGEYIFYMGNDTFCTKELLAYVQRRCIDNTFYIICRRHIVSVDTMDNFSQSKVSKRWGASGAWVAHRNVWNTLKGFDQRWIYYGFMDREIVWRSQMHGFNIRILPMEVSVYHIRHPFCEMRSKGQENEKIFSQEELKPTRWDVNDENWGLANEI